MDISITPVMEVGRIKLVQVRAHMRSSEEIREDTKRIEKYLRGQYYIQGDEEEEDWMEELF